MRLVSPLVLSLIVISACLAQTSITARYENLPGGILYNNGYLLSWDSPQYTQITIYGRDAKPAFSAPERTDDRSSVVWAVDSDGVVARAYRQPGLAEGRVDLLNQTGDLLRAINTGSYIPQQVVFAPDHSIWTANYNARNEVGHDFNVLHHYAQTGEELGQALAWSQIAGDLKHPVIESPRGGQLLYIANDRIGWNAALRPGFRTWIEVNFSGELLGKYDLKTRDGLALMAVAMTAGGRAYARTSKPHVAELAVLDRSMRTWQKVVGYPGGVLIGSEGDNLVFARLDGAWATLKFAPSGSLRVEEAH